MIWSMANPKPDELRCPKCNGLMQAVTFKQDGDAEAEVEVDRCVGCGGIWFDALEKEVLAGMGGSESVDTGNRKIGKRHNWIGDIDCPRCHTQMIKMVDIRQPHIWYEACSLCGGVYFDAGEFTDFKFHTLADWVRSVLAKPRM